MSNPDRLAALAREWDRLLDSLQAITGEMRSVAFNQLITAYGEPHRHYHDLKHILEMMDTFLLPLLARNDPEVGVLTLAAWYHDFVYDPHRKDNEARSAAAAAKTLTGLGVSQKNVDRVCDLILMTRDHRAPAGDENAQLFLDGDLWILGAVPELYREYCTAIRKEHAWVGDCDFYQARRSILIGFLNRPKIYGSEFFQVNGFEASACANITAEIAQIDDILRTLPS